MTKLVLASRNRKKIAEMQTLLNEGASDEIVILSLDDVGFEGDIEENGTTFEENALIKAKAASEFSGLGAIADDSGLMVDALDGAPGVYSARFAGDHGDDEANNQLLLKELTGVPDEKRTAAFQCAIALLRPGHEPLISLGSAPGVILHEARGENGFGYDPLFFSPELQKTFAEASADEKNAISHRGRALEQLRTLLQGEEK